MTMALISLTCVYADLPLCSSLKIEYILSYCGSVSKSNMLSVVSSYYVYNKHVYNKSVHKMS